MINPPHIAIKERCEALGVSSYHVLSYLLQSLQFHLRAGVLMQGNQTAASGATLMHEIQTIMQFGQKTDLPTSILEAMLWTAESSYTGQQRNLESFVQQAAKPEATEEDRKEVESHRNFMKQIEATILILRDVINHGEQQGIDARLHYEEVRKKEDGQK